MSFKINFIELLKRKDLKEIDLNSKVIDNIVESRIPAFIEQLEKIESADKGIILNTDMTILSIEH